MKSPVVKRSIVIAGHKTSVSLEDQFWDALKEIAANRRSTLSEIVASIDLGPQSGQPVLSHPPLCPGALSKSAELPRHYGTRRASFVGALYRCVRRHRPPYQLPGDAL